MTQTDFDVVESARVPRLGPYSQAIRAGDLVYTGLDRVIKVTCYVGDPAGFSKLNDLFGEFFPDRPPVRSAPIVQLPRRLLFSIDAIAVVRGTGKSE